MQQNELADRSELVKKVTDELTRCFKRKGRGTASRILEQLGLNRNYFKDWKAERGRVDLATLEQVLLLLDENPLMFFMRALTDAENRKQYEILEALGGVSAKPSEFIEAIRKRARSEGVE